MNKYLKDSQVSEALSVHRTTIWRWVKEGKFPKPVKLTNGSTRWLEDDVKIWISNLEVNHGS